MAIDTVSVGGWGWSLKRDQEGWRVYTLVSKVITTDKNDGPFTIMNAAGLPAIGAAWSFGNDFDSWAFCHPDMDVQPVLRKEPNTWWRVSQKFSNKPLNRCQDETIEDPLLEPPKVSGSFVKYTKEIVEDRNGNKIKTSSHEMIRGPIVEFDHNRPTVVIEQNVASLGLETFSAMIDTVNDATLWGLGARKIKLSNAPWSRKYHGLCSIYYTRRFEFDIDFNNFDRKTIDEGTKILDPDLAAADKNNPKHFVRYKDRNGENTRVLLDGNGNALANGLAPVEIDIEHYTESDFLQLGIPTTL